MTIARGFPHGRAVVAMSALLATLGARAGEAPGPAWIAIEAGVYEVNGAEYYLDAYRIQARATGGEYKHDVCEAPRGEEWLVAARKGGFTASNTFEWLAEPPEGPCAYSPEAVEAEGVEGWVHFAGLGAHLGNETKVVSAPVDGSATLRFKSVGLTGVGDELEVGAHVGRSFDPTNVDRSRKDLY